MKEEPIDPVAEIQKIIDSGPDIGKAPPYVRGMDLTALIFKSVSVGRFEMEWVIGGHLTHYDGVVQGGIVNVIADTGQAFAFWSTSTGPDTTVTSEFTTRFFRPMKTGDVIDVFSEVINRSRRMGVVESKFINRETGKLCAMVVGSWMTAKRDFGEGESAG